MAGITGLQLLSNFIKILHVIFYTNFKCCKPEIFFGWSIRLCMAAKVSYFRNIRRLMHHIQMGNFLVLERYLWNIFNIIRWVEWVHSCLYFHSLDEFPFSICGWFCPKKILMWLLSTTDWLTERIAVEYIKCKSLTVKLAYCACVHFWKILRQQNPNSISRYS